jgi:hypothetical protein
MKSKNLLFAIITFLTLFSCSSSQYNSASKKEDSVSFHKVDTAKHHPDPTTGIYIQTIEKYIEAVYQRDKTILDTLFILKRSNGQPDDFPDIDLPTSLKNTKLILLNQKESDLQKYLFKKTSPCVNIIGWIEEQKAEFMFVTFFPEFKHQFDCQLFFKYNELEKDYVFEQFSFKSE